MKTQKKIEIKVGEKFTDMNGDKVQVVAIDNGIHYCDGCCYNIGIKFRKLCEGNYNTLGYCTKDNRSDKQNVIFNNI